MGAADNTGEYLGSKTVAAGVIFANKPTANDINKLIPVKQRAKRSHGVESFAYYTTNECEHELSVATEECIKPYNAGASHGRVTVSSMKKDGVKFINSGILMDTGDLFDDLLDQNTADRLGLQYNEVPDRLKSADGQRVELLGRSKQSVYIMFPPLQV